MLLGLILIVTNSLVNQSLANNTILLLGDSLSASYGMQEKDGWVMLLNEQLSNDKANYKILNASISGETTGGGLARLPGILAKNKIDYILIELGGNDGLRGFPPKLIKNNLLQIIALAKQQNITIFLAEIRIPPNYGLRYNTMFSDVFSSVSEETNSELIPFFLASVALKPELMQQDGIHPTKAAQPLIAAQMRTTLDKLIN